MQVAKQLVAINQIIAILEARGYIVDMFHDHYPEGFLVDGNPALECSHVTTISFFGAQDIFMGQAFCSVKDQFNHVKGAQVAFNRAMHTMSECLGRDQVKEIVSN